MKTNWLEDNYKKVSRKGTSCKGCCFEFHNHNMGYDFCEEIPCYPHMYAKKNKGDKLS